MTPKYGIFRFSNKMLLGYTEHSFHMGWESNYVRAWKKKDIDEVFSKVKSKFKKSFIVKITHPYPESFKKRNIDVKIFWKKRAQDIKQRDYSFVQRNVMFGSSK